jgi:metal-sulfur cluster biosynthetic enzyme
MEEQKPAERQSTPITEKQVYEALKECYDPEIPVNVVDLGLIYEVKIIDNWVGVKMTLTATGCPAHSWISQNVKNRLLQIPGIKEADVRIVWEPQWTPSRMSEEARKKLGVG